MVTCVCPCAGWQELLKVYNVVSSGVWNKLPDSTKEIISPFRESRYRDLASDSDSQALIPHPVFGYVTILVYQVSDLLVNLNINNQVEIDTPIFLQMVIS